MPGANGMRVPATPGRTTMCPVELGWDDTQPPSLDLLPIHTRRGDDELGTLIDIRQAFEIDFQLRQLFEEPTVAGLAAAIDRAILRDYRLCATHFLAHELLHGPDAGAQRLRATLADDGWAASEQRFRERLAAVPEAERDLFLAMYANPLRRRLELEA